MYNILVKIDDRNKLLNKKDQAVRDILFSSWWRCIFMIGITAHTSDNFSSEAFIVLHSFLQAKSVLVMVRRMKKESFRESYKPCLLSHLCISGQSLHEVGFLVGLLVSESHRNSASSNSALKIYVGKGLRYCLPLWQALWLKHTQLFLIHCYRKHDKERKQP